MKSIRIVSKGRAYNTQVFNSETGEELHGISAIEIERINPGGVVFAKITFTEVELDVIAEVKP